MERVCTIDTSVSNLTETLCPDIVVQTISISGLCNLPNVYNLMHTEKPTGAVSIIQ